MEKIILFTKSHWKKLSIASIPVIYGVNYIKNEYDNSQHMRHICNIVNQYSTPKNNKLLVVLNPVANKKRCEKMFKKYCEPVLHMAGYSVDVVKTKHIGHAKAIMETLHKLPDVVVVAGGDGTSSEVVTGLIRRNEEICPILFLPLGEKNETVLSLMENKIKKNSDFIQYLTQCVLTLVDGNIQHHPVVKYELIENTKEQEPRKPIFGLHTFSWGILKDIDVNKDKYWYFGALRHHASALITSLSKNFNQNILANIISTPPCPGCNKCELYTKNTSWFTVSKLLPQVNSPKSVQLRNTINKSCSIKKHCKIDAQQLNITCQQNSHLFFELNTAVIENISSRFEFLIDMMKQNKIQPSNSFESRTVEVIPVQSDHQTYYIDGEEYDARHIKISCLPNALKYFC